MLLAVRYLYTALRWLIAVVWITMHLYALLTYPEPTTSFVQDFAGGAFRWFGPAIDEPSFMFSGIVSPLVLLFVNKILASQARYRIACSVVAIWPLVDLLFLSDETRLPAWLYFVPIVLALHALIFIVGKGQLKHLGWAQPGPP